MGIIEVLGGSRRKNIEYVVGENGCWECVSHRTSNGYPTICIKRKYIQMSRYVYERFSGSIADGLVIRHKCDNKTCINPNHLEVGTAQENMNDKVNRNRQARQYGEANGNAKLTTEQVLKIINDTRKIRLIANEYNINKSYVYQIKSKKYWSTL